MIDQGQVRGALPCQHRTVWQMQTLGSRWPMPCGLGDLDPGEQPQPALGLGQRLAP